MKIIKKVYFMVLLVICFMPFVVEASSYYGVISGAGVRIRKSPDTTDYYKLASSGEIFDMSDKDLVGGNNACPNGWYKVNYNGNTGYVCSNYLRVYEINNNSDGDNKTPANDCEASMQQAGFPATYWNGLCQLKQAHPNWTFTAKTTDNSGNTIDWNMSVAAESSCGANTISTNDSSMKDTSCTRATDTGYSPVSEKAVRYYLDPRNFLDEVNIFMFEKQDSTFNLSQDSYQTASSKVFGNSFMAQQIPDLTYYIRRASEDTGINSVAISSRIKQEIGNGKATTGSYAGGLLSVISGDYSNRWNEFDEDGSSFNNYYNFYNVGAYDGSNVRYNAIRYAKRHEWGGSGNQVEDRIKAITGGASFLKNKYINAGQNTIYFQKFNTFPTNSTSRYLNQYMTNIAAPVSEARISYNAYRDANLLETNFEFIIPVYSGMNANNVLVENNVTSNDNNSNDSQPQKPSVDSVVNNSGFAYNNGYITRINPGTSAEDVKNSLQSIAGNGNVTITDANGNSANGVIGTGYKININGSSNETIIVVVYGDASGDGQINALDLLKIQKDILGSASLNGSYKMAADASKDGAVNALDLLKVQKKILGSGNIEQ